MVYDSSKLRQAALVASGGEFMPIGLNLRYSGTVLPPQNSVRGAAARFAADMGSGNIIGSDSRLLYLPKRQRGRPPKLLIFANPLTLADLLEVAKKANNSCRKWQRLHFCLDGLILAESPAKCAILGWFKLPAGFNKIYERDKILEYRRKSTIPLPF